MRNSMIAAAWKLGINDPTYIAWLIVFVYFLAAFQSFRAIRASHSTPFTRTGLLWCLIAVLLLMLGFNKQLDLHQLVLETVIEGKERIFNGILFVGLLVVLGAAGFAAFLWAIRLFLQSDPRARWAVGAICALLGFQVLRFAPGPFKELLVAHVLTEEGLLHIHIIELLELVSLCMIGMLAIAATRNRQSESQVSANSAIDVSQP